MEEERSAGESFSYSTGWFCASNHITQEPSYLGLSGTNRCEPSPTKTPCGSKNPYC